jgi:hypothetical protein
MIADRVPGALEVAECAIPAVNGNARQVSIGRTEIGDFQILFRGSVQMLVRVRESNRGKVAREAGVVTEAVGEAVGEWAFWKTENKWTGRINVAEAITETGGIAGVGLTELGNEVLD